MRKRSLNFFLKTTEAILLFLLSIQPAYAQKSETDSLRTALVGALPAARIEINYLIGSYYFSSLPDSAINYFNAALELSQAMNNDTLSAKCMYRIGILKYNAGAYDTAIGNLFRALNIFERNQDPSRALLCLQYLGMAYNDQGMYDKALDYGKKSLDLCVATGDKYSAGVCMTNIGSVYFAQADYDQALEHFQQALQTMEAIGNEQGIADALNNIAMIYEKKSEPQKALEFLLRSLALTKKLEDTRGMAARYHNIGLVYKTLGQYPIAIRYLDSCLVLAKAGDDKSYLKEAYHTLAQLYAEMGNFKKAYGTQVLYAQLNDTLFSEENKRQFAEMNIRYETERKDHQIVLLNKDRDMQKFIRNAFVGGFAIMLLFAGVVFFQRNKIRKGKQQSDALLLNILPLETAEELKATGTAKAKNIDGVTVLFTDFENFTALSEKLSPQELVNEIHFYYSAFDNIISSRHIEKIKTIGDSYMCAGGLHEDDCVHAEETIKAALEIRDFTLTEKNKRMASGQPYFEIRIGCNTGSVVAGIVGTKKFAYDIWGDTVNIASRMESSGETGKVNISGNTYEIVKDKFVCLHRGKIKAKNKGMIDMYFVEEAIVA